MRSASRTPRGGTQQGLRCREKGRKRLRSRVFLGVSTLEISFHPREVMAGVLGRRSAGTDGKRRPEATRFPLIFKAKVAFSSVFHTFSRPEAGVEGRLGGLEAELEVERGQGVALARLVARLARWVGGQASR